MAKVAICHICGNAYTPKCPNSKYCGKKCSREASKKRFVDGVYIGANSEQKKDILSLSEMNNLARKNGMTYGEFVQWCNYMQSDFKPLAKK